MPIDKSLLSKPNVVHLECSHHIKGGVICNPPLSRYNGHHYLSIGDVSSGLPLKVTLGASSTQSAEQPTPEINLHQG